MTGAAYIPASARSAGRQWCEAVRSMTHLLAALFAISLPVASNTAMGHGGVQAETRGPAVQQQVAEAAAVYETGPDDTPGVRIQFGANEKGQTVWTALYGQDWQRVLRGQMRLAASIRLCTGWDTPYRIGEFRNGEVEFDAPISNRPGQRVQGVLRYRDPPDTRKIALPFTTSLRVR